MAASGLLPLTYTLTVNTVTEGGYNTANGMVTSHTNLGPRLSTMNRGRLTVLLAYPSQGLEGSIRR